MKIAFIVDVFPKASHQFIVNQVTGLLERGHDVTVYSTGQPKESDIAITEYDLSDRTVYTPIPSDRKQRVLQSPRLLLRGIYQSPTITLKSCNPAQFGRDALSLRPLYRAVPMLGNSFDIVHAHFGPKGRIAAILKQIGIPGKLVTTFHGFGARQARKHPDWYSRLFSVGDRFLANSRYMYKELLKFGVDEEKIRLHYNSLDIEKFPFRWSASLDTLPEPIKLITVARLEDIKGIEYSLKAVAQLQETNNTAFEYHVVGDGSQRSALKSIANELGIASSVIFHGHKHKQAVKKLLTDAHLFLLPSIEEAFGMVLLEAQAVGLPIVASNVGGIPEAVVEGRTAQLVPPGDPQAIASAVIEWIDNFERWHKIGLGSREFVQQMFDRDELIEETLSIYSNCL